MSELRVVSLCWLRGMIIEYIGGPYDGARVRTKDDVHELRVPIREQVSASYIPPEGDVPSPRPPRTGLYIAEPYDYTIDKKSQSVRIRRRDETAIFHLHAYVFGGAHLYYTEKPILFYWQGEP